MGATVPAAPRVLGVFGPTATGKSAVAHGLALRLDGEIVVCDPFQRYRGLEIAADSPRPAERAEVPYHVVGDLDLTRSSSAGAFAVAAHAAVDDILARGRVPIVAGGTGLYLRAALCDLAFPSPPDEAVRAWADGLVAADPEAAADELRRRDPAAHAAVDVANPRRLARALERAASGQPTATDLFTAPHRLPTLLVALERPRAVIDALIARRVRRELDEGLVAELEAALRTPGVAREPLQVIGAAEVAAMRGGTLDPDDLPGRLAARTRRLARRQLQWLRRMPDAAPVPLGDAPAESAVAVIERMWHAAVTMPPGAVPAAP